MLLDRKKYDEFGFIGDELFNDAEKDQMHKCMVAEQAISDGDFSFEEALLAYELTKDEYENYIAKKSNANIFISLAGNTAYHSASKMTFSNSSYFEIFAKMLENSADEQLSARFHSRIARIIKDFHGLSKDMRESKEKA